MYFRRLQLALALLILAALTFSVQAQKKAEVWTEWETISPEGEEFTVSMPKNKTTESIKFPYHKMELTARMYLASSAAGPVLAITSLSGIKSDPASYSEFARFNSYIDAFKGFFPAKVRTKETPMKLVLVSSRPFHGHTGRSYRLTIGNLSGTVHAFATKKRFYAIASLNTKQDNTLEEKFLSSFELPERQIEQPKVVADTNAVEGQAVNVDEPTIQKTNEGNQAVINEGTVSKPPTAGENPEPGNANGAPNLVPNSGQPQPNQKRGPIQGGMLNGKAIYLPVPEVPAGQATGVVMVAVVIDEQGGVIEARAISGPSQLHAAAVSAARLARFSQTLLMGEPVRVSGTISYNFVRSN
jgi:hypothetical protein